MISFAYTILYVAEVERSVSFYEKAFGFKRKFVSEDGTYGELDTGNTTLAFAAHDLAHANLKEGYVESSLSEKPFGIEIAFTSEDVAMAVDRAVAAGATLVEEPMQKPWGQIVADVRDLDGFLIEICTPMS